MTDPSLPEPSLRIRVRFRRGPFTLEVDQRLPACGVTALTGAEGSGKTTLLRVLSGWLRPEAGNIAIGDETWFDSGVYVPVHRRSVAMVFQDRRLIEHLNVADNLDFASRRRLGARGPERSDVVAVFGLAGLLTRAVPSLSGGERLRVALAQALLGWPRLLLLDEVLGGLSRRSRSVVMTYVAEQARRHATGIIMVSHDVDDIADFADRAMLMRSGRVVRLGAPSDIVGHLEASWPESAPGDFGD